jgi:hypothetical protein
LSSIDDPGFGAALVAADALHKDPRRPRRPTHLLARAILVPLGESLLEDPSSASAALARVRAIVARDTDGWQAAVDEELTLAATEHVRSCDPKALKLAAYDFPYTVAARHRLEARLRAAAELDLPASETLLDQIERADRLLAPHLERRR